MARKIVAGNWKMNMLADDARKLFNNIDKETSGLRCELIICPPVLYIQELAGKKSNVKLGAQNVAKFKQGAYTGEWSAEMLSSIQVSYCIVGHSERRSYFNETDEDVNQKVKLLLANDIQPILCCGETLSQRKSGIEKEVVKDQLLKGLSDISIHDVTNVIVAYEPVWAIGTGVTAKSAQAQDMHAFIRSVLKSAYGDTANDVSILYGGSCKPDNAQELFACQDIDGGLIGGASLEAASFLSIAKSFR